MAMDAAGLIPASGNGEETEDEGLSAEEKYEQLKAQTEDAGMEVVEEDGEVVARDPSDYETPEGNEVEVAEVETTTTEFEDDETEGYEDSAYPTKTKSSMYGMMKKPKVTFIV
jgi:hypothetical protein